MRTVEFYDQSRAAQDHFVDATTGAEPPAPLLVSLGGPTKHRGGWILAIVALLAAIGLALRGFGELGSAAAVQPLEMLAVLAVLFALVLFGVLHALAGERETAVLPWKAGVYAFPTALIDARTHRLVVHGVDELERIEDVADGVALVFAGGARFAFRADASTASAARAAIEDARASGPTSDPKARASRDPLAEPRISSPLAPTEPRKRSVPAWAKLRVVVAAVFGVAVGAGVFFARNAASDDRMFSTAKQRDDVASYRAYLRNGVRHNGEVSSVLLPRAELTAAKKDGSVDAILLYQSQHPGTAIQKEVDAALHAAMLAELEEAKKPGTLAALSAFEAKRPKHGLDAEVKAAVHAVYQAALAKFRAEANEKDPQVIAFFERLVAYAEAHRDPKVEIRVRALPSSSMGRADKYVTKQPMFNGETSYPSRYFDPAKLAPYAQELGKSIAERLNAAFPAEILAFSVGAPVEGDPLPAPTVPTLFVSHVEEWSGTAYPSNRPRGIYVGLGYHFTSTFRIPGDAKPFDFKVNLPRSVSLKVLADFTKVMQVPGEPEKAVYEEMSKGAFEQFATRWLAAVFKTNGNGNGAKK